MTVWHLRDLCSNKRTKIKCDAVKIIQLPHYEGITIEDIVEWAADHKDGIALKALPENKKELMKLPRAYIANVVYTIAGDPFKDWSN